MKKPYEKLSKLDQSFVWHPFTQMKDWISEEITIIEEGEGVFLKDLEGRTYIDGVSSLWCNVHGHRRPEIDEAIRDQLGRIAHSTFLGLSHAPAILLAEKLVKIAPPGLRRVFYSDSGSEAVEIALKIAFQYWQHRGRRAKRKFARLVNAYHGDTIGAVSVGGIDLFHEIYKPLLFETLELPSPYRYRWPSGSEPERVKGECLARMEEVLDRHGREIAALVMEPLMQGAAGMIDQPEGFMRGARELATRYGVLLIFDEVATGFGRTGRMFAADHEGVSPDILVLAKGLTGGYLPLAVTLATEEIFEAFLGDYDEFKTFFHGHTYTANPLAARAALASLDIFDRDQTLTQLAPKIGWLRVRLRELEKLEHVGDIRQAGFMVGIELVQDKAAKTPYPLAEKMGMRVCRAARERGIWTRPLGNVIVIMPPLVIDSQTLEILVDGVEDAIAEAAGAGTSSFGAVLQSQRKSAGAAGAGTSSLGAVLQSQRKSAGATATAAGAPPSGRAGGGDSRRGPGLARGPQPQYSPGVQAPRRPLGAAYKGGGRPPTLAAPGEWPSAARSLDAKPKGAIKNIERSRPLTSVKRSSVRA